MPRLYLLLVLLFTMAHVPSFCHSRNFINEHSSAAASGELDGQHLEQTNQSHPSNMQVQYKDRGKRDSPEVARFDLDKRLRDFVGKRSRSETYPHLDKLLTLMDVPRTAWFPVETSNTGGQGRQLSGSGGDLADFNEEGSDDGSYNSWIVYDKRLRDFVGKRSNEFSLEKRLRDFVGKRSNEFSLEKRLRDFVGKRLRDFVGKRGDARFGDLYVDEKRLRDFVGKRAREFVGKRNNPGVEDDLQFFKRLRDFVGKRDENVNDLDKRPRQFVGKRVSADKNDESDKRPRDFVGKREARYVRLVAPVVEKRPRQFVGKRNGPDFFSLGKRLRDFVGKRYGPEIFSEDKRLRDFVGKRAREFVGKRFPFSTEVRRPEDEEADVRDSYVQTLADGNMVEDKRLRDFVGKRSELDGQVEDIVPTLKRLRDFVGKRSVDGLETLVEDKRGEDFVGRR